MVTISASGSKLVERALEPHPDHAELRESFGRFASGVTIISGMDGREPIGFTCQSFHSVSLDPPLISIGVMSSSTSYPRLRASGSFCVNVLADHQHELAVRFGRRGEDRWRGLEHARTARGNPLIPGVVTAFECLIVDEHLVGDHLLVIAEVATVHSQQHVPPPLVYFRSCFRELAEPDRD